jgi:hypothetical protein
MLVHSESEPREVICRQCSRGVVNVPVPLPVLTSEVRRFEYASKSGLELVGIDEACVDDLGASLQRRAHQR